MLLLEGRALPIFFVTPEKRPFAGSHGYLDATADPDEIEKLALRFRGAKLIAVATGAISGIDVLDIDPRHGGDRWFFEHRDQLPKTRVYETRGGGWHFIFKHSPALRSSVNRLAHGVEFLSTGRFAVRWSAHSCRVLCEGPVATLPAWLRESLRDDGAQKERMGTTLKSANGSDVVPISFLEAPTDHQINYAKKALGNAFLELRACPAGCRNAKLNALAYSMGRLIARGWISRSRVETMLLKGAEQCGLLTEDGLQQCRNTIDSGVRAGMTQPYHDIGQRMAS
jgi:hypothetical protein